MCFANIANMETGRGVRTVWLARATNTTVLVDLPVRGFSKMFLEGVGPFWHRGYGHGREMRRRSPLLCVWGIASFPRRSPSAIAENGGVDAQ